jgi:hypothetical protein
MGRGLGPLQRQVLAILAEPEISATSTNGTAPVGILAGDLSSRLFGEAPTFSQLQSLRRAGRALEDRGLLARYPVRVGREVRRTQGYRARVWEPCTGAGCEGCRYGVPTREFNPWLERPSELAPETLPLARAIEVAEIFGVHWFEPAGYRQQQTHTLRMRVSTFRYGRPRSAAEQTAQAAADAELEARLQKLTASFRAHGWR